MREVTGAALGSGDERFKIEVLTLLTGVGWPTASVILHFCDQGRYPILDFRALSSLGLARPPAVYDFPFWDAYCRCTRNLAHSAGVGMRVLDRALWAYSRENSTLLSDPAGTRPRRTSSPAAEREE